MKVFVPNVIIKKKLILMCLPIAILLNLSDADGITPSKKELLSQLIKLNDENIPMVLSMQLTKMNNAYYGAVFDADSVVSPIGTANLIQTLMCSYVSRNSKFYQSKALLKRMTLAGTGLLNLQHDDGTIDLPSTNFHSTPDLAFTIYPLASAYSIMLKNDHLKYGELPSLIKQYLLKGGKVLSVGGIHTPNHRWVVCGALAWLNTFFPNPMYRYRVEQWLAEKIDIDPDGQYFERSTAVYTVVTNRTLLDVAKKMNYDYLYDVVRKNLNMTFYFVHSNGEMVTESSTRQDKYQQSNVAGYYLAYNYMALLDKDSRYSGMASYIQNTVPPDHLRYMLPLFLEDSALLQDLPEATPIPTSYHEYFEDSHMARIREAEVDMSVITNNPVFFTYFKGEAALEGMRLSSAFFGKGQFESQQCEKVGDSYRLSFIAHGPYYQPLPKEKIPDDAETWRNVPRTERAESEIQTLYTNIYLTPDHGKVRIRVSVDGPENLPVTLELGFRMGGTLENVTPKKGIDNAFLIKDGEYATYQKGKHKIKIGPGARAHKWTQLRGALPKLRGDCLYFTKYSPCEFEFTIE